jgi:hypothetical protein
LLGAISLGYFGYSNIAASNLMGWRFALVAAAWLFSAAAVLHFLRQLTQDDIDFDGENWYFAEQVGTVSVRLDLQNGMLLRFESEFKRVSWLWFEAVSEPRHWHDLRRAVYSRPAIQNLHDLI